MISTDEILAMFRERGAAAYFGEPVTQTQHALQTAWHAARNGAPPALVVSALVHDIGHLLHERGEDIADHGVDARHERIGATWLSRVYPAEVTAPIRLHVEAKRYLCRVEPEYASRLSPASQQSLILQGGALSAQQAQEFEKQNHWQAAVSLRRWDDIAKDPDLEVDNFDHYRELLAHFEGKH